MTTLNVKVPKGTTSVMVTGIPVAPVNPIVTAKGKGKTPITAKGKGKTPITAKGKGKTPITAKGTSYIPNWVWVVFAFLVLLLVVLSVHDIIGWSKVYTVSNVVTTVNTRADNAEAKLAAANTRADNAEAKLAAANTRADNAEAKLAAANTRADNAEAKLAAANGQLSASVITKFSLGLPNLVDFREAVVQNGDKNNAVLIFGRDYPRMVLLRAVADDQFLEFTFHRNDGSVVDLLPMLKMQMMDNKFFASLTPQELQALKDRGINTTLGEILAQNFNSIDLGPVVAGEYITITLADDVKLGVNNGSLVTFGDAPENLLTVPLKK